MSTYRLFVYEKGPQKGLKEPEIYEGAKGRKYLRVREGGQDSMISLKTTSITEAIKLREARQKAKTAAELGVAIEPKQAAKKAKAALTTVKTVIKRYLQDGCPNKKGVPRPPSKHLDAERERCETLMEHFNTEAPAADLIQNDFDNFKDWRVAKVIEKERAAAEKRGEKYEPDAQTGLRTVDLDLNCLNNAMRWAVRKTLLKTNPAASRAHYYTKSDATHCREFAPENADELHGIAGVFMASRRSETLGWWLLYEGATGLRSEETVLLQMNARSDEPGGFTADGGSMCVRRAKKSKKFNLYVQVHEGLKSIRKAHAIWHAQRYPLSPWFFPGRSRKSSGHVDKSSLTKSLDRLYQVYVNFRKTEKDPKKFPKKPYLTRKYTSHGAGRAFYVLVRRSQGASDPQIAYELNQIGGVGTLEQVYGLPPEHWKNGNAPRLSWIPTAPPAWTKSQDIDFSPLQPKQVTPGDALTFDI
jgi:hypothetical protein